MKLKPIYLFFTIVLFLLQGTLVHAQETKDALRITKGDCSFYSDWGENVDVDHFGGIGEIDSTTFELEKWSKTKFIHFLDEFNAVCNFDKSIIYGEVSSLYNKSGIVNVEITETFYTGGKYEKLLIFYSCSKYGIISYTVDH